MKLNHINTSMDSKFTTMSLAYCRLSNMSVNYLTKTNIGIKSRDYNTKYLIHAIIK